jgi:hypothetical protein
MTFEYKSAIAIAIAAFDQPDAINPVIQLARDQRLSWGDTLHLLPLHPEPERAAVAARLAAVVSHQHPDHDTDVWPLTKTNR